jgi:hypothetical protein
VQIRLICRFAGAVLSFGRAAQVHACAERWGCARPELRPPSSGGTGIRMHAFDPGREATFLVAGVAVAEVGVPGGEAGEQVPDADQDGTGDGDLGLGLAAAAGDPPVALARKVAVRAAPVAAWPRLPRR